MFLPIRPNLTLSAPNHQPKLFRNQPISDQQISLNSPTTPSRTLLATSSRLSQVRTMLLILSKIPFTSRHRSAQSSTPARCRQVCAQTLPHKSDGSWTLHQAESARVHSPARCRAADKGGRILQVSPAAAARSLTGSNRPRHASLDFWFRLRCYCSSDFRWWVGWSKFEKKTRF